MILQPVLIRIPIQLEMSMPQRVQQQRKFARMALDHCARLSGAPAGPWPQNPEGAPIPRDGFHWSIAHKPRFAAAVMARDAVGIDIESLTPRGRDLTPAVAWPEEWEMIGKARIPDFAIRRRLNWPAFFAIWTAKEATLKANGKGIGGLKVCQLARIDQKGRLIMTYLDREWCTEHFSYGNHVAAVTCSGPSIQWHVIDSTGFVHSANQVTSQS